MPTEQLLKATKNPAIQGALGGAAGVALISALTSKKARKNLLKAGGVVAVGGLAYKAYQMYRDNQGQAQPAQALERDRFEAETTSPDTVTLLLDAMIAAANADGHLSMSEKQRIWDQAVEYDLPPMALAHLSDQLDAPPTVASIAARAHSTEVKVEVYTASVLAMDENCEAGESHLQRLATHLELPQQLTAAIHNRLSNATAWQGM